jgi:ATP-dependent exoDNAse (exonuclease V) alpha subunit
MVHIDQGVAVTSHAAQGKTVDQVLVSASIESFSQVNAKQFYVSMSRARESMQLFTDSTHALREAVLCDGSRKAFSITKQAAEDSIEFARKIVDLQQS